jgi:uncharacterized protein (DUF1697 family)
VTAQIAFLRGINLGNRNVEKSTLVAAFEDIGCEDVATFIASGNVVFSSPRKREDLERSIEEHLEEVLGYDVDAFVRTRREVARIATAAPFPDADLDGTLQVGFLKRPLPARTREKIAALSGDRDEFVVKGRELYWLTAGGVSETAVDAKALGRLVVTMTARNVNTIRRLAEKYPAR